MRRRIAVLGAVGLAALAASAFVSKRPCLVWNTTASTPLGLYVIVRRPPRPGDLVLLDPPSNVRALALRRGYVTQQSLLIKPVAAAGGNRVCRVGFTVWISGHKVATARIADAQRRPLPTWRGCHVLHSTQIFVLGRSSDSFDSRYFGVIAARRVVGIAVPIWTFQSN
jgi:conjugative transfer signal peptidase TraF